jgi:hypothetical protein
MRGFAQFTLCILEQDPSPADIRPEEANISHAQSSPGLFLRGIKMGLDKGLRIWVIF